MVGINDGPQGYRVDQDDAPPESGPRGSGVRKTSVSSLEITLRYWPERWPRVAVLSAMSLEPYVGYRSCAEWESTLDVLSVGA